MLVVGLEMPDLEMASRLVASGAAAHYGQITKRDLDDRQSRQVRMVAGKEYRIFLSDLIKLLG
ncbi:hypothetical protein [Nocardia sp. NPDC049707]|uniref:hypothetical protein n=1 Tax=Nocardia sp. NPDC049707 TaxID=3154735 RepID=UPI003430D08D